MIFIGFLYLVRQVSNLKVKITVKHNILAKISFNVLIEKRKMAQNFVKILLVSFSFGFLLKMAF